MNMHSLKRAAGALTRSTATIARVAFPVIALAACAVRTAPSPSAVAIAGFDRTVPPQLGPAPSVKLPPAVTRELPNGLRIMVVEHHELPLVNMILVVGTGVEADPANRSGLATLTSSLLDEGTATRDAMQIADQAAFLGLSLSTSAGWDASRISMQTQTAQLDSAMALFADVALRPSFPEADLDRLRQDRLTSLIQMRDRGSEIADRAYSAILYGANHPFGRATTGSEATVASITRADVQNFYRSYYRPNNSTLIVVGAVNADEIERRARAAFGSWERAPVPDVAVGTPQAAPPTGIYLIDKPGSAQSSVRIGAVGVPRATEDFFGIQVMNTILGGAFTSRLNMNLRETKGYTYGAASRFDMRRAAGPFTARSEIVTAKTDSALIEFMKELNAIREEVPQQELEKAKTYLQLQLPAAFETTGSIANQLVPLVLYDLPRDYYDSYTQRIGSISQADVQRVARRYIDPSRLAVVIVGDRSVIEPGISALGLAPISIRDITGQPIRP